MTSAAPATARATSPGARPSSVAPSRQRPRPGSASMNVRTGTRATSSSVRARNRVSQSGGEASSTTDGWGLTSRTNSRASSRRSSSPTPSNRTSTATQPGRGKRETGNVSSLETMPLSGSGTARDAIRRPPRFTASVAFRFPLPVSRFPAVPKLTLSRIVSPALTRLGPSTEATKASKNGVRGRTTMRARRARSGGMSARSVIAPSETTVTGPPRPAAASSAGTRRLAPSAGGNVSNAPTRAPNRQITPPRPSARAVSSASRHRPPWPAMLREASSRTSTGAPPASTRTLGFHTSSRRAPRAAARSAPSPSVTRLRTRAPPSA